MDDFFAGHSHGATPYLVTGCPLCDATKAARNQAIEHLSEALNLLSNLGPETDRPTIRINLGPTDLTGDDIRHCHSIDIPAKLGEALSDAIDSMNFRISNDRAQGPSGEKLGVGEWSAAAVAQNDPDLYAQVTDLFLLVDPQSYLDDVFAARDPEAAAAAYEQLVTGEWDGEL